MLMKWVQKKNQKAIGFLVSCNGVNRAQTLSLWINEINVGSLFGVLISWTRQFSTTQTRYKGETHTQKMSKSNDENTQKNTDFIGVQRTCWWFILWCARFLMRFFFSRVWYKSLTPSTNNINTSTRQLQHKQRRRMLRTLYGAEIRGKNK